MAAPQPLTLAENHPHGPWECSTCGEDYQYNALPEVDSKTPWRTTENDLVCGKCIKHLFTQALEFDIEFPARWSGETLNIRHFEVLWSNEDSFVARYEMHRLTTEYAQHNIDVQSLQDHVPEGLVQGKDFQRCPSCLNAITLEDGCNHMTCSCGASFCYICGQPALDGTAHWSAAGGGCPRYNQPGEINAIFDDDDEEEYHYNYSPDEGPNNPLWAPTEEERAEYERERGEYYRQYHEERAQRLEEDPWYGYPSPDAWDENNPLFRANQRYLDQQAAREAENGNHAEEEYDRRIRANQERAEREEWDRRIRADQRRAEREAENGNHAEEEWDRRIRANQERAEREEWDRRIRADQRRAEREEDPYGGVSLDEWGPENAVWRPSEDEIPEYNRRMRERQAEWEAVHGGVSPDEWGPNNPLFRAEQQYFAEQAAEEAEDSAEDDLDDEDVFRIWEAEQAEEEEEEEEREEREEQPWEWPTASNHVSWTWNTTIQHADAALLEVMQRMLGRYLGDSHEPLHPLTAEERETVLAAMLENRPEHGVSDETWADLVNDYHNFASQMLNEEHDQFHSDDMVSQGGILDEPIGGVFNMANTNSRHEAYLWAQRIRRDWHPTIPPNRDNVAIFDVGPGVDFEARIAASLMLRILLRDGEYLTDGQVLFKSIPREDGISLLVRITGRGTYDNTGALRNDSREINPLRGVGFGFVPRDDPLFADQFQIWGIEPLLPLDEDEQRKLHERQLRGEDNNFNREADEIFHILLYHRDRRPTRSPWLPLSEMATNETGADDSLSI